MLTYSLFASDFRKVAIWVFYIVGHPQSCLESHFLIDAEIAEIIFGVLLDRCVTENVTRAFPLGNFNVQNLKSISDFSILHIWELIRSYSHASQSTHIPETHQQ